MNNHIKKYCGAALLICAASAVTLNSCTEKIDESSLYTFTGEMMADHFENNPETFSSYYTILGMVHQSKRSSSTIKDLLDARGNYTCFAPTNEAIDIYLDSLLEIGEVESKNLEELPDSVAEDIVFNSIIENGDDEAYQTTSFADGDPLNLTNMNGRYITPTYGNDEDLNTIIFINKNSRIVEGDIEVENGYIHAIDHVLSPSKDNIAELIIGLEDTRQFSEWLTLTGWNEKISKYRDTEWEEKHYDILGTKYTCRYNSGYSGLYPETRNYGYTVFVEPDSLLEKLGITDITTLKDYVRANNNFDDETNRGNQTSWGDDYENPYNWLNQFVAYHILPEKLSNKPMGGLCTFANEYGVTLGERQSEQNKSTFKVTVNVWDYWETIGVQRRSLKITGGTMNGTLQRRINRKSIYNMTNYKERESEITIPGILILEKGAIEAKNGYLYPIDDILLWTKDIPMNVLNERMRYDVTSLFPELLTNGIKQNRKDSWFFPHDYFDNCYEITDATEFEYMPNINWGSYIGGWEDYQGDEFNIRGPVDFTMKLPPVPYTGTYELRFGVWWSERRGMVQIYMGKNPRNLPALGVPLDLRSTGVGQDLTGWVSESNIKATVSDSTALYENQKTMRNLGFMKAPKYIYLDGGSTPREDYRNVRKIIFTGTLEAGETYWIRYKSVLNNNALEFFYDYIELVPKAVYAGEYNEDIW